MAQLITLTCEPQSEDTWFGQNEELPQASQSPESWSLPPSITKTVVFLFFFPKLLCRLQESGLSLSLSLSLSLGND